MGKGKELRIACNECGGTGRVVDENNHADICTRCYGLGYMEVDDKEADSQAKKRTRRFYILASVVAVVLGLYYVGLYVAVELYGFSLLVTMVLFVGGHLIIFGGFLFYVLYRILKKNSIQGAGDNK